MGESWRGAQRSSSQSASRDDRALITIHRRPRTHACEASSATRSADFVKLPPLNAQAAIRGRSKGRGTRSVMKKEICRQRKRRGCHRAQIDCSYNMALRGVPGAVALIKLHGVRGKKRGSRVAAASRRVAEVLTNEHDPARVG